MAHPPPHCHTRQVGICSKPALYFIYNSLQPQQPTVCRRRKRWEAEELGTLGQALCACTTHRARCVGSWLGHAVGLVQ